MKHYQFGSRISMSRLILIPFLLVSLLAACSEEGSGGSESPSAESQSLLIVPESEGDGPPKEIVTIYFAGSNMNGSMWYPPFSDFGRQETIASLYHFQKDKFSASDFQNHHKKFVQGHWIAADWRGVFYQAAYYLEDVINASELCEDADGCVILNLVGFSRGAVSTMHFAQQMMNNPAWENSIKPKIEKINILAFDPVPGDAAIDARYFNLDENVEYVGFYAEDERSALFSPVFPTAPSIYTTGKKPSFFLVPGSHETMVGSIKKDGHARGSLSYDLVALDPVSRTLKIVATELLGSDDWGHVRFRKPGAFGVQEENKTREDNNYDVMNLDWYGDATDINFLEDNFNQKISAIYDYDEYDYIHNYSFTGLFSLGLLEAWKNGCWTAGVVALVSAHNPRCIYARIEYVKGGIGFSDGPLTATHHFAPPLNQKIDDKYAIWELIRERGSLDVDGDMVDYQDDNCPELYNPDQLDEDDDKLGDACESEGDHDEDDILNEFDNCPFVANPDQEDFDGDDFGDVCDEDVDGDKVINESDECPYTHLGEVVDPDIGCSLEQLAPCDGPRDPDESWRNHGEYVSTFVSYAKEFYREGLISTVEKARIISEAARSSCGKKKSPGIEDDEHEYGDDD